MCGLRKRRLAGKQPLQSSKQHRRTQLGAQKKFGEEEERSMVK